MSDNVEIDDKIMKMIIKRSKNSFSRKRKDLHSILSPYAPKKSYHLNGYKQSLHIQQNKLLSNLQDL